MKLDDTLPQPPAGGLGSQLLHDDDDLRDIVEAFVAELPDRIREMEDAHRAYDWERLTTAAHRLKGAGGSYGYPDISQLAAFMETRFKLQQDEGFSKWLDLFRRLIEAAREGLKPDSAD